MQEKYKIFIFENNYDNACISVFYIIPLQSQIDKTEQGGNCEGIAGSLSFIFKFFVRLNKLF